MAELHQQPHWMHRLMVTGVTAISIRRHLQEGKIQCGSRRPVHYDILLCIGNQIIRVNTHYTQSVLTSQPVILKGKKCGELWRALCTRNSRDACDSNAPPKHTERIHGTSTFLLGPLNTTNGISYADVLWSGMRNPSLTYKGLIRTEVSNTLVQNHIMVI